MKRIGILGGTGFAAGLGKSEGEVRVETPYGAVDVETLRTPSAQLFVVQRHGRGHALPPHRVAHRANVDALARSRVERIFAVNAVGSLVDAVAPPALVVPDDYVDFTASAERTFFDDAPIHVDVSEPYCPEVRAALLAASPRARDGGVYCSTAGPRFETPAEVRALAALGGTVVGMTGGPEAALARERGLCYATLALVTNRAVAARGETLRAAEVKENAARLLADAAPAILRAIEAVPSKRGCRCVDAQSGARI